MVKQYSICIVNLNPVVGSEMSKTRPVVVISPDSMNMYLNTIVVAPLTTTNKDYPTRFEVTVSGKTGYVCLDQIRTIETSRIVAILDNLSTSKIAELKDIILETFVD